MFKIYSNFYFKKEEFFSFMKVYESIYIENNLFNIHFQNHILQNDQKSQFFLLFFFLPQTKSTIVQRNKQNQPRTDTKKVKSVKKFIFKQATCNQKIFFASSTFATFIYNIYKNICHFPVGHFLQTLEISYSVSKNITQKINRTSIDNNNDASIYTKKKKLRFFVNISFVYSEYAESCPRLFTLIELYTHIYLKR